MYQIRFRIQRDILGVQHGLVSYVDTAPQGRIAHVKGAAQAKFRACRIRNTRHFHHRQGQRNRTGTSRNNRIDLVRLRLNIQLIASLQRSIFANVHIGLVVVNVDLRRGGHRGRNIRRFFRRARACGRIALHPESRIQRIGDVFHHVDQFRLCRSYGINVRQDFFHFRKQRRNRVHRLHRFLYGLRGMDDDLFKHGQSCFHAVSHNVVILDKLIPDILEIFVHTVGPPILISHMGIHFQVAACL